MRERRKDLIALLSSHLLKTRVRRLERVASPAPLLFDLLSAHSVSQAVRQQVSNSGRVASRPVPHLFDLLSQQVSARPSHLSHPLLPRTYHYFATLSSIYGRGSARLLFSVVSSPPLRGGSLSPSSCVAVASALSAGVEAPDTNTSLSQLLLLVKCDSIGHFFSQNALTVSNQNQTQRTLTRFARLCLTAFFPEIRHPSNLPCHTP